ncbi:M20 family metallopeptidase [Planococcus lenghuensis]|uniref:Peptidase M20 n=1 Tax=Planococcus lenghuensis TaxID=2213202 RepID=A0A1Q2L0V6_9BACL|nr:M20 family metallopeptidase [Planococcus lenghuensis]AQQ54004.1 peptidase M20 [Planococcus lenghuensis]
MDRIQAYIAEHLDGIIADIKFLVEADSPSSDKQLADQCGKRVQELYAKRLGCKADVIEEEEYGNHLRFEYGNGENKLLLLSHFDTVWDQGELTFREEGNRIYGPGILDMKSGLVQAIWALKACRDLGISLNKKIVHICTSDEEIGSPSARTVIKEEAKTASFVLVTEPPVEESGALKTCRKGSARYFVRISGKAAHSGNHHDEGISAIREAAEQILYLESLTDYETGTTINVGAMEGGGALNVVADSAVLGVDVRTETEEEQDRIAHLMEELTPHAEGVKLEVEGGIMRPPMQRTAETGELFERARKVAAELGIQIGEASVGGGSDGNFTSSMGIPTLDGLGAAGSGMHAKDEHILKDQIPFRTALLGKLIVSL